MTVEGKRIAFLGSINHKKGIQLLIEGFRAIHEADPEFTLHIGGSIQDVRYGAYLDYAILDLKLQDSIHYAGKVDDVVTWLQDKDFILISSPLEGCPVGLLEAASVGLKPLIHSFVGSNHLYPAKYIWKTVPQLVEMALEGRGDPKEYRDFVKNNYSLERNLKRIENAVADVAKTVKRSAKVKKDSTVSAIIAVKNGEKTIAKAIGSLQEQTKPLSRIVVVDDASTDETVRIVSEISLTSKIPIHLIENKQSKWVFAARNEGFRHIDSDYFFFLDADDQVPDNYVQEMSKILDNNPTVAVSYCDLIHYNEFSEERMPVSEFSPQALMEHNYIAYASMQRTKLFKEVEGFSTWLNDTRNHLTEWDLWMRMVKKGFQFKRCTHTHLYYYRAVSKGSDGQMSANYERNRLDMHVEMAVGLVDDLNAIQMQGQEKRILLVCQGKDYCDRSRVGFELLTWCKPLEDFGDVFVFQYDVALQHYGKDGMLDKLETMLSVIKPDVIFHPSYREDIPGKNWKEISGVFKTICWNSDDDRRFDSFSKEYGKNFTYSVTTYSEIYNRMDHPGRMLSQWAANTSYFHPREKTIDVSFCGQKYGNREEMLSGLDVERYGLGWDNGFIDFKDMADVLGRSKIGINFSGGADGNPQIKLRTFEICASGALCLCEYVDGLDEYYVEGREIVFFRDKKELKDLMNYYLAHEKEREAIVKAAYERTIAKHTWKNRLENILKVVYV